MSNDFPFKVTGSKIVYKNPWIAVREDAIVRQNGTDGIYGYIESGDSVVIVAVDKDAKICIIESYRHPVKKWRWELPGGGGDGEDSITAARRELQEETGMTAPNMQVLGKGRVYNGLSNEYQTNVLATGVIASEAIELEDEIRAIKFVTLAEIDRMIADGSLDDNQSIVALYMYKSWLQSQ